jgi:propanol-preferring alcohol dehydrogenase
MKAWQFTGVGEPLALNEVAEPVAGPGRVVVDVRASGLCHSDVGILEDPEFPFPPGGPRPMTLGHEIAGVISEIGEGVTGWKIGDRVGICMTNDPAPGLSEHGGFAAKVATSADFLVKVPDNLPFSIAAAATDSGVAPHHAVIVVGEVTAGTKVGIMGVGGLGQMGARIAVLAGAEVFVAEPREEIWPMARELGVARVAKDISEFTDENLDVIIDFAGVGSSTTAAIETVRAGGRVVQVGMSKRTAEISTYDIVTRRLSVLGTMGGWRSDLESVYKHLASGDLKPVVSTISFDRIADGLARLSRGEVVGRLVALLPE